jgi:hypothetical protein
MRRFSILLILILVPSAVALGANGRTAVDLHGKLGTGFGLKYSTGRDRYWFDFPLYGGVGLTYESGIVEGKISFDYVNESGVGETYVQGGTRYSNLKAGNFTEQWGIGYGSSMVSILNSRDTRYPDNIFYWNYYRPNPMFSMTVGRETIHGQFVVSGREGVPSSMYDALLGTRLVGKWEGYDMSLGFVRRAGLPPSLFFLTAETEEEGYSLWSEIGWYNSRFDADLGSLLIGYKRELRTASIITEYSIWGANSIILVENVFHLSEQLDAGAKAFVHFADLRDAWSMAMNLFLRMAVENGAVLEPGIVLFFGRAGTLLGPHNAENDNSLYLRFSLEF